MTGESPVMSTVEEGLPIVGAVSGTVVDTVVLVVETLLVSSRVRSYATVIVTPARVERDDRAEAGRHHSVNLPAPNVTK